MHGTSAGHSEVAGGPPADTGPRPVLVGDRFQGKHDGHIYVVVLLRAGHGGTEWAHLRREHDGALFTPGAKVTELQSGEHLARICTPEELGHDLSDPYLVHPRRKMRQCKHCGEYLEETLRAKCKPVHGWREEMEAEVARMSAMRDWSRMQLVPPPRTGPPLPGRNGLGSAIIMRGPWR